MPSAPSLSVQPLDAAMAKVNAKTPVGTALNSRQLERVPLALRERAQLSARVESIRIMAGIQDSLQKAAGHLPADGGTVMTRERFRKIVGDIADAELGAKPRTGGLTDIRSIGRLNLVWDMQTSQARGFARWQVDTDADNLNAVPAQEFKRVEGRKNPRTDWEDRWSAAGGQFYGGRMIALKTDPVWRKLSRFGTPWPPYDYGSGMGVEDVYRSEAVVLGLIREDEQVKVTQQEDFNAGLEMSLKDIGPELGRFLSEGFGDQVKMYRDGRAAWMPHALSDYVRGVAEDKRSAPTPFKLGTATKAAVEKSAQYAEKSGLDLNGKDIRFHAGLARHQYERHGPNSKQDERSIPMTPTDYDLIGTIVRNPDRVTYEGAEGALVLWGDLPNGQSIRVVLLKGAGRTAVVQSVNKLKSR